MRGYLVGDMPSVLHPRCYTIPALLSPGRLVLVVSPLIGELVLTLATGSTAAPSSAAVCHTITDPSQYQLLACCAATSSDAGPGGSPEEARDWCRPAVLLSVRVRAGACVFPPGGTGRVQGQGGGGRCRGAADAVRHT
jgi:hypothetical protein